MRRGYLFLLAVSVALQLVSAGDDAVVHNMQRTVGGSVLIRCGTERMPNLNGMYLQKTIGGEAIFINGFYTKELGVLPEYINRTFVDKTGLSVKMTDLKLSDEGDYTCIFFCKSAPCNKTKFHLTVTANYSVPVITAQGCGNGPAAHNCVIACSSSGGYPRSNVTWNVLESQMKDEADSEVHTQDKHSRLWNVSRTATLNCSRPLIITCSVGGVTSRDFSVCEGPREIRDSHVVVACVVVVLPFIFAIIIIVLRSRRIQLLGHRPTTTDAELENLNSRQAG